MAWNGSGSAATSAATNKKIAKPRKASSGVPMSGAFKGTLALILVLAIGAGAYWFVTQNMPKAKEPTEEKVEKKEIEVVEPEIAEKSEAVEEKKAEEPAKPLPPQKIGETRDGYIKLPSGRLHKVVGVVTNKTAAVKGKYAIFERHCDNEIAGILSAKPGQMVVGTPRYNGRFTKDFLESLTEPMLSSPDDTPEQKELRRAVIEAKADLKAAYDRGEDIEQIMLDARAELQKLARFQMEVKQAIVQYKKSDGVTDQDVEDYVNAANQVLESKGIAPVMMGPITKQKFIMMRREGY